MENEIVKLAPENLQVSLPSDELKSLYKTTSSLVLSKEESNAITAEFDQNEIEIRPDGHIYLPQSYYRNRLNQSLGIGQWGLVIKGSHQDVTTEGEKVKTKFFLPGMLVIRGCLVAEAVGEAELHADNPNQSIASCWESAKSDCITRCCKDLSIAMQIYQPNYVRKWQADHAVQVWVEGSKRPVWRKISAPPFWNELGPLDATRPFPENADLNKPQLKWLNKSYQSGGESADWSRVTKRIAERSITLADILKEFKVNTAIRKEIDELFKAAQRGTSQPQSSTSNTAGAAPIASKWYAILDRCRTKEDVNDKYRENQAEVDADEQLKTLFRQYKTKLPNRKVNA